MTFGITESKIVTFINNVSLNIFAGAIVLFMTSLAEYMVNRRKKLEELMNFILEYRNYFSKVKYLKKTNYLTYDQYKKKFNKDDSCAEKMFKTMDECDEYNKNNFQDFDEIIEAYISISKINFNEFWNVFDDLRFIFNNKKKKDKLYNNIFKYIYNEVNLIRELSLHLSIYKNKGADPIIMYDKIREYQKNIFYEKNVKKDESLDEENMKLIKDGLPYEIILTKNSSKFVYNKISKHLDEQFNDVGKLAYFNKKYNGKRE